MDSGGEGTHIFTFALLLVILSGLVHAVWNLFTKRSLNKVVFLWLCQWVGVLVFMPVAMTEWNHAHPAVRIASLFLLCLSSSIHGFYIWLLAKTYTLGDLSQVYPIMRGTSPLLVPLLAVLLLHEHLSTIQWAGVVAILMGIIQIGGFRPSAWSNTPKRAVLYALTVGALIASYTLIDKVTLQYFPAFVVNQGSLFGNAIALTWVALKSKAIYREWSINWKTICIGGTLAPGGYTLFLSALKIAPVAQLAPIREIGTVFGAILGVLVLHEGNGKSRILASIFIVSGVLLLA